MEKLDKLLNLKQSELAKILCCTQARISQILSTKKPTIRMMAKMSKVTGLPLRDIVGYFYDIL